MSVRIYSLSEVWAASSIAYSVLGAWISKTLADRRSPGKLYFGENLLNTPLEFTEGTSQNRPIQREFYDITLLAGVRVSL